MFTLLRPVLLLACALSISGWMAPLSGASVALRITASQATMAQCSGSEVSISFRLENLQGLRVAGAQAFLRYPAAMFAPVRYEVGDLHGFTATNGPVPFGSGFLNCSASLADPWDDGLGMDTVALVSMVYGSGGDGIPITATDSTIGSFVFHLLPGAPAGAAAFGLEFDSCNPLNPTAIEVFGENGDALDVSFPASQVTVQVTPGVVVRNLNCTPNTEGKGAALSWTPPTVSYNGVNVYRNGEQIRSLVPTFTTSLVDEDAPNGVVHYELSVVVHGNEDPCRAACSVTLQNLPVFVRGNVNGDDALNIADVSAILNYLYRSAALSCAEAADVDDSSEIDITDVVTLLGYMFQNTAAPSAPYPDPGVDPTPDSLGCTGA